MIHLGFSQSFSDPTLFLYIEGSILIILLLYADDVILAGDNNAAIGKLIATLSAEFDVNDLGTLSYFLGLQIHHILSQAHLSTSLNVF